MQSPGKSATAAGLGSSDGPFLGGSHPTLASGSLQSCWGQPGRPWFLSLLLFRIPLPFRDLLSPYKLVCLDGEVAAVTLGPLGYTGKNSSPGTCKYPCPLALCAAGPRWGGVSLQNPATGSK